MSSPSWHPDTPLELGAPTFGMTRAASSFCYASVKSDNANDRYIAVLIFDDCWWKITYALVLPLTLTAASLLYPLLLHVLRNRLPTLFPPTASPSIPLQDRLPSATPPTPGPTPAARRRMSEKLLPRTRALWDRRRLAGRMVVAAAGRIVVEVMRWVLGAVNGWVGNAGRVWTPGVPAEKRGGVVFGLVFSQILLLVALHLLTAPARSTTPSTSPTPLLDRLLLLLASIHLLGDVVELAYSAYHIGLYFAIVRSAFGAWLAVAAWRMWAAGAVEDGETGPALEGVMEEGEEGKAFKAIPHLRLLWPRLVSLFTIYRYERLRPPPPSSKAWREHSADLLSTLSFSWLNPLILLSMERQLRKEDLWELDAEDRAEVVWERFKEILSRNPRRPNHLLHSLITLTFNSLLLPLAIFSLTSHLLLFAHPFFIHRILTAVSAPTPDRGAVLSALLWLLLASLGRTACESRLYWLNRRLDARLRAAVVGAVFDKTLRRQNGRRNAEAKDGKDPTLANLISSDTDRILACFRQSHYLVSVPVLLVLCFGLLVRTVGVLPGVAGIGALALAVPATQKVGKAIKARKKEMLAKADERMSGVQEILRGIKAIKIHSWEPLFTAKLLATRTLELLSLSRYLHTTIATQLLWRGSPLVASAATFLVHALTNPAASAPSAATAFTVLTMFNNVLRYPLFAVPKLAIALMEVQVSVARLEGFLAEREVERLESAAGEGAAGESDGLLFEFKEEGGVEEEAAVSNKEESPLAMAFRGGAAFAYPGTDVPVVRNLNVEFPTKNGAITVIVGPTGSGKTSLLLALLGELRTLHGAAVSPLTSLSRSRRTGPTPMALVAQAPWLENTTVRDNILFGSPLEPSRYEATLRACALDGEFPAAWWASGRATDAGGMADRLRDGRVDGDVEGIWDLVAVGDNGGNLSGGQRQRVCLARALYSRAPILFLDDVFSALDAKTARHVAQTVLTSPTASQSSPSLASYRTRVVIASPSTLDLCLPQSDFLVLMKDGGVVAQAGATADLLRRAGTDALVREAFEEAGIDVARDVANGRWRGRAGGSEDEAASPQKDNDRPGSRGSADKGDKAGDRGRKAKEEDAGSGRVTWPVYKYYMDAGGGPLSMLLVLLSIAAAYVAGFMHDFALKEYSSQKSSAGAARPVASLAFYLFAAVAALGLLLVRFLAMTRFGVKAAERVHAGAIAGVLGSPLGLFETTPAGRFLNRFGKDLQEVDQAVMSNVGEMVQQLLHGVWIVGLVMVGVGSLLLPVAAVPIVALYYPISKRFLSATRSFKRLESTARSPIFSCFNEASAGVTTLRAFTRTQYAFSKLCARLNDQHAAFLPLWATNRWLAVRVEVVGSLVAFSAGAAMAMRIRRAGMPDVAGSTGVDPGWFALALNYAGMFTDVLTWLVRNSATLEMSMTSVERLKEYVDLPPEPPRIIRACRPPSNWPSQGAITLQELEIRYAPHLPVAFSTLSSPNSPPTVTLGPGQRVGVVGRTGSGKTTLGLSVLRLVDPARGLIEIDGINLRDLGLEDIRRRITVIPQEPFLYRGTLRENLDPYGLLLDATMLEILSRLEVLKPDSIGRDASGHGFFQGLGDMVDEGMALSAGQKQMVCVARAICKILSPLQTAGVEGRHTSRGGLLVLDEATANLDPRAEKLVMSALQWATEATCAPGQPFVRGRGDSGSCSWTLVMISHRLSDVMEFDRILVLSAEEADGVVAGRIVEDGEPRELVRSGKGRFWELWREAGLRRAV
ncbi:hypothetical protein HDU96_000689 [Phlyctochytrium bullatum]|nr:hypothetical protein HDU96_000689 [Phlyctochytrium bullatum]